MSERLTYTVPEVAALLGLSRGSAYLAARAGEIPTLRVGRRLLVPRHALGQLLGEPLPVNDTKGGEPLEEVHGPAAAMSASGEGDTRMALEP